MVLRLDPFHHSWPVSISPCSSIHTDPVTPNETALSLVRGWGWGWGCGGKQLSSVPTPTALQFKILFNPQNNLQYFSILTFIELFFGPEYLRKLFMFSRKEVLFYPVVLGVLYKCSLHEDE